MSALVRIKVKTKLKGVTQFRKRGYLQTGEEKPKDVSHAEWEEKTKEKRVPINMDGFLTVPATAFKKCVKAAAVKLKRKVPEQGTTAYGSVFATGFKVLGDATLTANIKDAVYPFEQVPSDGKPNGGKKVGKYFPTFPSGWECDVEFYITDSTITEDIFSEVLEFAGMNIGIGTYRPENGVSDYGCFEVNKLEWDV